MYIHPSKHYAKSVTTVYLHVGVHTTEYGKQSLTKRITLALCVILFFLLFSKMICLYTPRKGVRGNPAPHTSVMHIHSWFSPGAMSPSTVEYVSFCRMCTLLEYAQYRCGILCVSMYQLSTGVVNTGLK
jgi:hypothetical protein